MFRRSRSLSLLPWLALLLTPALAAPAPPEEAAAVCARHLQAIGRALAAYQRGKSERLLP